MHSWVKFVVTFCFFHAPYKYSYLLTYLSECGCSVVKLNQIRSRSFAILLCFVKTVQRNLDECE